jgi:hypothetical protein
LSANAIAAAIEIKFFSATIRNYPQHGHVADSCGVHREDFCVSMTLDKERHHV